jgi:uncharacterized protein
MSAMSPAAAPAFPDEGLEDKQACAAARRLGAFAAALRGDGFAAGLAETRDALAILGSDAARRPSFLKAAWRSLFSSRRSDWERFDALFEAYWLRHDARQRQLAGAVVAPTAGGRNRSIGAAPEDAASGCAAGEEQGSSQAASPGGARRDLAARGESLLEKDIRHMVDPDEAAKLHLLVERLAKRMRARLVRREQARRHGRRLDVRRTIHHSVAHGGAPFELVWRRRKKRPLRLVLLLDASGSMEPYTAFFVRFIHAVVDSFREAEAFIFHSSLTHVSQALREHDVARAVGRLALLSKGMGGGTRIGECLGVFNRWHAQRVLNARTAVIILSDGYDTGEPERLSLEMARLSRRCRRIVWLNPLLGWKDYAPTARGMQAALPYLNVFAPAHNLESLAALGSYLMRL